METKLNKFYAITDSSSLYEAVIGGEGDIPHIIKIDMKGESKAPIGFKMSDGTMIAICKSLIMFIPEGGGMSTTERQISMVNTRYWGGSTSLIVALFITEKEARFCLENHMGKDHQQYRNRWKEATIEVLRAIGNDHPYCSIETTSPNLWLIPSDEWRQ